MLREPRHYLPLQLLRVAGTPLLLLVPRGSYALLAAVLLLLDAMDCVPFTHCASNRWYRATDKLLDLVQYAAALCVVVWTWAPSSSAAIVLLGAALAYRSVGVALAVRDDEAFDAAPRALAWLALFPDVFKELLLLLGVAAMLALGDRAVWLLALGVVVPLKVAFERLKAAYDARFEAT